MLYALAMRFSIAWGLTEELGAWVTMNYGDWARRNGFFPRLPSKQNVYDTVQGTEYLVANSPRIPTDVHLSELSRAIELGAMPNFRGNWLRTVIKNAYSLLPTLTSIPSTPSTAQPPDPDASPPPPSVASPVTGAIQDHAAGIDEDVNVGLPDQRVIISDSRITLENPLDALTARKRGLVVRYFNEDRCLEETVVDQVRAR
jgi:hypothetical protein